MAWYDYILPTGAGPKLGLWGKSDAEKIREQGFDESIEQQAQDRRAIENRRQQDLDRTMSLYGPALQALERLYGIPMSAWGEALPQNRTRLPTRTGMLPNGQSVSAMPMRTDFLEQMPGARNRIGSGIKPIQGLQSMGAVRPQFQGMTMAPGPQAAPPPPPAPRPPRPGAGAWKRY